jgi:hypothetical protein
MYTELKLDRIQETLVELERRIGDRFPDSGLRRLSAELVRLSTDTGAIIERLRRPIWRWRLATLSGIALIFSLTLGMAIWGGRVSPTVAGISEWLQGAEALISQIVFLGLAIIFLVSLEPRAKRRIALRSLHRLRSVVHIVDMHQLTKDPEPLLNPRMATESSPSRKYTRFELARYLDYCSELLSISSKLAALHVQYLNDPVILNAVNDIETLAANLSRKIWQKIMILDIASPQGVARARTDPLER